MFRRRASDAPAVLDRDEADAAATDPAGGDSDDPGSPRGFTAAKGRPTPKRSEAEKRRRQPFTASGNGKATGRPPRDADRAARQRRMEAMRRGEDWALPRKDQGPVKALARDVVDARRGLSEYYLFGVIVLVAVLFLPGLRGNLFVDYVVLAILVVLIGEGWYVGRKVAALARERLPGENTGGVKIYAAMRGTQIRKMRVPAPRVERGARI